MSRLKLALESLRPWAGLVVGLLAFAFVHQFGSDGTFNDCRAVGGLPSLAISLLGLIVCVLAGIASWSALGGHEENARRVVAIISAGSAALFAFAILLAIIAGIILPPCFS